MLKNYVYRYFIAVLDILMVLEDSLVSEDKFYIPAPFLLFHEGFVVQLEEWRS